METKPLCGSRSSCKTGHCVTWVCSCAIFGTISMANFNSNNSMHGTLHILWAQLCTQLPTCSTKFGTEHFNHFSPKKKQKKKTALYLHLWHNFLLYRQKWQRVVFVPFSVATCDVSVQACRCASMQVHFHFWLIRCFKKRKKIG